MINLHCAPWPECCLGFEAAQAVTEHTSDVTWRQRSLEPSEFVAAGAWVMARTRWTRHRFTLRHCLRDERDQPTSSLSPAHTATSLRDKCLVVCWVRMAGHTCPLITIARCAPLHCSGGPWILNRFAEHHANYFWRCAPCSSRRRQSNRCLGFRTWEKRETKKVNLSICSGCSVRHEEIVDAPCLKLVFFCRWCCCMRQ